MSLRLIRPGMSAATRNPFAGFGDSHFASSDDPDDPTFTGGGGGGRSRESDDDDEDDEGGEDDEDDEEDDDKEDKKRRRSAKKGKDDEEDEEGDRPHRQAARYRVKLRAAERERDDLKARMQALEDKDKKPDEVTTRNLAEATTRADKAEETVRNLTAQLAFFRVGGVEWVDPSDAFALAEREGLFEDVIDEDGTVDTRELRRGLRDLAKRKSYLVKSTEDPKARGRKVTSKDDDEDDDEDDEPRSPRTGNGTRRGKRSTGPSRAELAKQFPVLNRR